MSWKAVQRVLRSGTEGRLLWSIKGMGRAQTIQRSGRESRVITKDFGRNRNGRAIEGKGGGKNWPYSSECCNVGTLN